MLTVLFVIVVSISIGKHYFTVVEKVIMTNTTPIMLIVTGTMTEMRTTTIDASTEPGKEPIKTKAPKQIPKSL